MHEGVNLWKKVFNETLLLLLLLLLLLDQTYRRFRAKVATYVQSDLRYDLR
jgi:hypothetical protein